MAVSHLIAARSSAEALLAEEIAAQAAGHPKPSYSIDGESVDWTTWRNSMVKMISDLTDQIIARNPYVVRTRQTL